MIKQFSLLILGLTLINAQIQIQLQSNWENPPFELRILETLASEDEDYYLPVLSKIGSFALDEDDDEEVQYTNDQQLYDSVWELLSTKEKELYQIPLANKLYSPRIISHYNYYNETVLSLSKIPERCGFDNESWVQFNDAIYCDPDDIYALRTDSTKSQDDEILLPFDRVIGESGPLLILYANVKDYKFKQFISNLYDNSQHGKLRFIVRYIPQFIETREILHGYGVDLTLKRTDYIVIDDRDINVGKDQFFLQNNGKDEVESNIESIFEKYVDEIPTVNQEDIEDLGLKLTGKVLSTNGSDLSILNKLIEDFPKFSSFLSTEDIDPSVISYISELRQKGLVPGSSGLYVNGVPLDEENEDIFNLYSLIKNELLQLNKIKSFGFDSRTTKKILGSFAQSSREKTQRARLLRHDIDEELIIYFNDLENDAHYENILYDDPEIFLERYEYGTIPPIKSNLFTAVFVVKLTDQARLAAVINTIESVKRHDIAQRVGIIPLVENERDKIIANNLYYLAREKSIGAALKYLTSFVENPDRRSKIKTDKDYVSNSSVKFVENFDVGGPVVIANGVFVNFDNDWAYVLTRQITDDYRFLAELIYSKQISNVSLLKKILYQESLNFRNALLVPDEKLLIKYRSVELEDLKLLKEQFNNEIIELENFESVDQLDLDEKLSISTLTLAGNFGSKFYLEQALEYLKLIKNTKDHLRIRFIHTTDNASFLGLIHQALNKTWEHGEEIIQKIIDDNQFIENDRTNPNIQWFLDTTDIDSNSFILLDGYFVSLESHRVVDAKSLQFLITYEVEYRLSSVSRILFQYPEIINSINELPDWLETFSSVLTKSYYSDIKSFQPTSIPRFNLERFISSEKELDVLLVIDPLKESSQKLTTLAQSIQDFSFINLEYKLVPEDSISEIPIKRFYRADIPSKVEFNENGETIEQEFINFDLVPENNLFTLDLEVPEQWIVVPKESKSDLDNVLLSKSGKVKGIYELENIIIEGFALDVIEKSPPTGLTVEIEGSETNVMTSQGYLQLKANPGLWNFQLKDDGVSDIVYSILSIDKFDSKVKSSEKNKSFQIPILSLEGPKIYPRVIKNDGKERIKLVNLDDNDLESNPPPYKTKKQADINIFTIASGHLYERLLSIMTASVMAHTDESVKFWIIDNYMSPTFRKLLPSLSSKYGFEYELITYKWPTWLLSQREKQRTIWGYKILFLDVLFPRDLEKVIFVDADQIIRTDLKELIDLNLEGAPYGFTPMGESREEMEGYRFWKQGYWADYLNDKYKYHISALYVVDLVKFRRIAAGDRLRITYQQLSKDPKSLSNLDQDLPNSLQHVLKIYSLPDEWLWCETWCDDKSLKNAKTIDLCNNPLTKEHKLDRAKRLIPEWNKYDDEIEQLKKIIFEQDKDQSYEHDEIKIDEDNSDNLQIHDEL
ncbi:hypothetical protein WICMUC_004854 [Wickerhamomyces mucosus]|uniref:Glycosyltransferase family 24 protein n=1 Tax=Wickerhamomyces mucosus TaxID=1378264 RepID=A0A9P8PDP5_9ASCO|nr:hypothetical protein WICMUC_004854 [Wickerhamomyces mucosus]